MQDIPKASDAAELYYVAPDPFSEGGEETRTVEMLCQPKYRLDVKPFNGPSNDITQYYLQHPFLKGRFRSDAVCLCIKTEKGKTYLMDTYGCVREGTNEYFVHPGALWETCRMMYFAYYPSITLPKYKAVPVSAARGIYANTPKIASIHYIEFDRNFDWMSRVPTTFKDLLRPTWRLNVGKLSPSTHQRLAYCVQQPFKPGKFMDSDNRLYLKLTNGATYRVDGGGCVRSPRGDYYLSPRNFLTLYLQSEQALLESGPRFKTPVHKPRS